MEDFEIVFDETIIKALKKLSQEKVKEGEPLIFENIQGVILEDLKAKASSLDISILNELLGDNIALFSDIDFKDLSLPVLARNYLEEGISKNLWYEEVVPKKSKFYFVIAKPTNLDEPDKKENLDKFERQLDEKKHIQFGANKSIGYGYSKVEKVSE